jgi:glucosamine-6-phosphate deaminase
MSLQIEIAPDAAAAGRLVASRIAEVIRRKPNAVIGVATGSSPHPVYAALAELIEAGLNANEVSWFALDEYLGLPTSHPESYRSVLERALIEPLGLDPSQLHVPNGAAADPDAAARAYEEAIEAAGVDVQLVGIGENGHVGFNEPGTSFEAPTHRAVLTDSTRRANSRFFASVDDVPAECLTQGLATIMRADRIELIATGAQKAAAVAASVSGPVTTQCPASILREHPRVRFTLDPAAAVHMTGDARIGTVLTVR